MDYRFRYTQTLNDLMSGTLNYTRINLDLAIMHYLIMFFKPSRVLEIGFNQGLTFGAMIEASPDSTQLISIDINPKLNQFYERFPHLVGDDRIKILTMNSDHYNDSNTYEFINVDGDHTMPRQYTDIVKGAKLLSRNGILMVDDWRNPEVELAIDQFLDLDTGIIPFLRSVQSMYFHYPDHNAVDVLNDIYKNFHQFCNISPQADYKSFLITDIDSMQALFEHNDLFYTICEKFKI